MLRRIHTQLGTDPEDLNSPGVDGNIPAGLASSRNGKTTPMPMVTAMLDNVDTDGFFAEYQNSSSSHDSNDMSPSAHEFAGFGLADRSLNLYPMEGQLGSSAGNVANPWGIQNGYDWVSPRSSDFSLVFISYTYQERSTWSPCSSTFY
jgi:hypothetical protein